ncbi:MAG TPA: hypothetical protein VFL86_05355 [Burkholderiaceae bacterium]|nr:hypothetical protein [Burkholderiaceae bacterium]
MNRLPRAPALTALILLAALAGCSGSDDTQIPESTDSITQLEKDYGGPDGLRKFFDKSSPEQIQQALAPYGIGYVVHPYQAAAAETADTAASPSGLAQPHGHAHPWDCVPDEQRLQLRPMPLPQNGSPGTCSRTW